MTGAPSNLQVKLRRRPVGAATAQDFELAEAPVPEPGEGDVLVRVIWLSLDPYMRGRMSDAKSYVPPVGIGEVMGGGAVGEVIASRHAAFRPGEIVVGSADWQQYAAVPGASLSPLDLGGLPLSAALGVLGMPGLTAWVGMADIGKPKPGETVVVSAATGAVGSVAGQIARLRGARVVGIAGGAAKCAYARDELGFVACADHRGGGLDAALDAACPDGIDVYFENVGGAVQAAVFPRLRDFARMAMCGMVAEYNDAEPAPGPSLMPVVRKRLRIEGFIVSDQYDRMAEWRAFAIPRVLDGSLRYREDVVDGLEHAPEAFIGLLAGRNFGKLVVRVGPDAA